MSENLWCRRWSATQRTTGPSIARLPATASAIFSTRFALKDPWVKKRWNPTVTPWQAVKYITTMITMSCQPSPQPHATGTAASSARNGTRMNEPNANCSAKPLVSPPRVAEAAESGRRGGSTAVAAATGSSDDGLVISHNLGR